MRIPRRAGVKVRKVAFVDAERGQLPGPDLGTHPHLSIALGKVNQQPFLLQFEPAQGR